jgi:hypothetical protein
MKGHDYITTKCTTASINNLNIYLPFLLFLRNIRTPARTNPDLEEETAHVTVHVCLGESVAVENARLQGRVDPHVGVQLLHQRTAAECKMSRYTYWQCCGFRSGFNAVPGSGFGFAIRIQDAKMTHKVKKS